jgi:flagellar basal body rod protein FlgC
MSDITLSGLNASSYRVANAANNIANAETEDFQAKDVVTNTLSSGGVEAVRVDRPISPFAPLPNVDLSEELINVQRAAQAYEAGATVLKIENSLHDTLIEAFDEKV